MLAVTLLVMPSMTDTELELMLVTYIQLADGFTLIPTGELCTVILCNLELVEPSITDTVSEPLFVTYTLLSKGLTATPYGKSPTVIVPSTLLLVPLITDRLFENSLYLLGNWIYCYSYGICIHCKS